MASYFRSVYTEVLAALRVDHVSLYGGSYNLSTVSGTPCVDWGDGGRQVEFSAGGALVLLGGITSKQGYDGATMGEYGVRTKFEWFGFVATDDQSPETRALAAIDLANDLMGALNRAHANASGTNPVIHDLTEFLCSLDAVYGDGDDIPPGMGVCFGSIEYFQTLARGT